MVTDSLGTTDDNLTQLLTKFSAGDRKALAALFPLVYTELKGLAHQHLARNQRDVLLQTTALVHDVYERLVKRDQAVVLSRQHFFSLCTRAIRQIIIDQYRRRSTLRRGGNDTANSADNENQSMAGSETALYALGEALERLSETDERMVRVFEMSQFGGLSTKEIAEVLQLNSRSVYRDLARARAWVSRSLCP